MDDARISELLKAAAAEPKAPQRLVERTCWKARVAEERLAKQAPAKKPNAPKEPSAEKAKGPQGPKM